MEQLWAPFISVAGSIIATLLGWIGWLIKKRIDDSKANRQSQEETRVLIEQFVNNQEITLDVMKNLINGLQLTLKSDDLQFKSIYESGLMNGESVQQRKEIQSYLHDMDGVKERLDKIHVNRILGDIP